MILHNHVGMDAKMFVRVTKSQAAIDDLYWLGIDKNRQPINNGESDKINKNAVDKFVTVHYVIIFDMLCLFLNCSGFLKTWRSKTSQGQETLREQRLRTQETGEND